MLQKLPPWEPPPRRQGDQLYFTVHGRSVFEPFDLLPILTLSKEVPPFVPYSQDLFTSHEIY